MTTPTVCYLEGGIYTPWVKCTWPCFKYSAHFHFHIFQFTVKHLQKKMKLNQILDPMLRHLATCIQLVIECKDSSSPSDSKKTLQDLKQHFETLSSMVPSTTTNAHSTQTVSDQTHVVVKPAQHPKLHNHSANTSLNSVPQKPPVLPPSPSKSTMSSPSVEKQLPTASAATTSESTSTTTTNTTTTLTEVTRPVKRNRDKEEPKVKKPKVKKTVLPENRCIARLKDGTQCTRCKSKNSSSTCSSHRKLPFGTIHESPETIIQRGIFLNNSKTTFRKSIHYITEPGLRAYVDSCITKKTYKAPPPLKKKTVVPESALTSPHHSSDDETSNPVSKKPRIGSNSPKTASNMDIETDGSTSVKTKSPKSTPVIPSPHERCIGRNSKTFLQCTRKRKDGKKVCKKHDKEGVALMTHTCKYVVDKFLTTTSGKLKKSVRFIEDPAVKQYIDEQIKAGYLQPPNPPNRTKKQAAAELKEIMDSMNGNNTYNTDVPSEDAVMRAMLMQSDSDSAMNPLKPRPKFDLSSFALPDKPATDSKKVVTPTAQTTSPVQQAVPTPPVENKETPKEVTALNDTKVLDDPHTIPPRFSLTFKIGFNDFACDPNTKEVCTVVYSDDKKTVEEVTYEENCVYWYDEIHQKHRVLTRHINNVPRDEDSDSSFYLPDDLVDMDFYDGKEYWISGSSVYTKSPIADNKYELSTELMFDVHFHRMCIKLI